MEKTKMARYVLLIERGEHGYGGYVPDVPGCIATGSTPDEVERALRNTLANHLALLQESGELVPQPTVTASYGDVDLPAQTPHRVTGSGAGER